MNSLHTFLKEKLSWYRKFHEFKHSHLMLWAFFVTYSMVATYMVYSGVGSILPDTQFVLAGTATTTKYTSEIKTVKLSNSAVLERLRKVNENAFGRVKQSAVNVKNAQSVVAGTNSSVSAFSERQKALTELAFTNPREVRMFVFDQNALNIIPKEARLVSEVPFNKNGKFSMWVLEGHGHGEYTEQYYVEVSPGERYRLSLTPEEARRLRPKSNITIKGMKLTSNVVIPLVAPTQISNAAPLSASGTSAVKKVAVVAFNFKNDTSIPVTTAELKRIMFTDPKSVAAYYREVSYGQLQIQGRDRVDGDVYGWVTVDINLNGRCEPIAWRDAAKAKIAATGVSLSGYDAVAYVFPDAGLCPWAGIAEVGGDTLQQFNPAWKGMQGVPTFVHELGHEFGLDHASAYGLDGSCKTASSIPGACQHLEYGDLYDPMGSARSFVDDDVAFFPETESPTFHFSALNKAKLWLRPEQILTVTASGRYELSPNETNSSGYKVIRIARPFATSRISESYVPDGYYYLEYRRPYGFDAFPASSTVVNSVGVRLASGDLAGYHGTFWLGIRGDRAIAPNKPLIDNEAGIEIRVSTTTPTKAIVDVTITPKVVCLRYPPEAVDLTPVNSWLYAGNTVTYQFTVRSNDSPSCPQRKFRAKALFLPVPPIENAGTLCDQMGFRQFPEELSFSLNPGETKTLPFNISVPPTTLSGMCNYALSVIDDTPSATHDLTHTALGATINILPSSDTTPPEVVITEPVQGTSTVKVIASATDESGVVSMDILIDGTVVKTCTSTVSILSCEYPITSLTIGAHNLTVKAVDKIGNVATKVVDPFQYRCTRRTPTVTITRTDPGGTNPWKKVGETAYYAVKVIHKSSPECGRGVYKLEVLTPSDIQASVPSIPPGTIYITGSDGSGATVVLAKPLSGASAGSKQITLKVIDVTGFTDNGTPPMPLFMAPTDIFVSTTTELVVMTTNDTKPPTLSIDGPINGEVVKTIPKIKTTASDPSGVMSMFVTLDTILLKNCVIYPSFQISATCIATSSSLTPGPHTITLMARDGSSANNSSSTKSTFIYTP